MVLSEATPRHLEAALFETMLEGWRAQQAARRLSPGIVHARERVVRRFAEFCHRWPWQWSSAQLDAWVAKGAWSHSTIRSYEGSVAAFLDYICDPRYGFSKVCEERVGMAPTQICHEANTATHVADYEGRPERRPLTRDELQLLFDVADDAVADIASTGRKGFLPAFRDATLFKVIYAWGLRRREAAMLDVGDFGPNPAAPELGGLGTLSVRFGKAMRGSPPKRRQVASVMPWAVEALDQYLKEVRPRYGPPALAPPLWLTERGQRISPRSIDERFASWRKRAGLPAELSVHCLRHSYVSHLIENGVDPLFVQHQVGHSFASTTAVYTSIGQDHKNRMLRSALESAFSADGGNPRRNHEAHRLLPLAPAPSDGCPGDVRHH